MLLNLWKSANHFVKPLELFEIYYYKIFWILFTTSHQTIHLRTFHVIFGGLELLHLETLVSTNDNNRACALLSVCVCECVYMCICACVCICIFDVSVCVCLFVSLFVCSILHLRRICKADLNFPPLFQTDWNLNFTHFSLRPKKWLNYNYLYNHNSNNLTSLLSYYNLSTWVNVSFRF